jgi:hypothetical protein
VNFVILFKGVDMKSFSLLTLMMALLLGACAGRDKDKDKRAERDEAKESKTAQTEKEQISEERLSEVTTDWPEQNMELKDRLVEKYGRPHEATSSMVIWHNNGPWVKTVLTNETGAQMLRQTASFHIPAERMGEVSMYNQNITFDRARSEVTANSQREELNFLALNLAKEIVDGRMSPFEARRQYANLSGSMKRDGYMDSLLGFPSAQGEEDRQGQDEEREEEQEEQEEHDE